MRNTVIAVLVKIAFIGSLVLLTAATASADSVIYTSPSSNFLNQSITITVLGNTENIINAMAGIFVNASLNTSIEIPSIATIRVEDLTNMFSNSTPNSAGIGIGDSTLHFALFGLIPANSYQPQ